MESVARFFGLSNDATETEIHAAVDGVSPLAEQLEEARNAAESKNGTDITEMKARLESLEAGQATMTQEMEVKDGRIAELQTQIAASEEAATKTATSIEALKTQHDKEIKVLAGQVSSLKAGKSLEQDAQGDAHAADKKDETQPQVAAVQSEDLKKLMQKRRHN